MSFINNLIAIEILITINSGLINLEPKRTANFAPKFAPINAPIAIVIAIEKITEPCNKNTDNEPKLQATLASFV